jgi:hypothetical protein
MKIQLAMSFFHPDYTVGIGVSPIQRSFALADFTAGGEVRPALKNLINLSTP